MDIDIETRATIIAGAVTSCVCAGDRTRIAEHVRRLALEHIRDAVKEAKRVTVADARKIVRQEHAAALDGAPTYAQIGTRIEHYLDELLT